ncbi:MAG: transposase [Chloroflexi bacterium]|nr:transposase [Chloroflexota bacterium]
MNKKAFTTLLEAKTLVGDWCRGYNEVRPHIPLGYRSSSRGTTQPALTLATVT